MFFERVKAFTETLRFRLAVWNAAVVVLTAIVTMFGLREGIRLALLHETDQILLEDMREIELGIPERNYPASKALLGDLNRKAEAHQLHGWYVRFLDADSNQLFASVLAPPKTPPMPELASFKPITKGQFRIVQNQISLPSANGVQELTIRVGSSLQSIEEDLRRIDQKVVVVSGLVLLIAPACGYWLAGRATRPLADIIRTTANLRPTRLEERLTIHGTGDELDQLSLTFNKLLDRIAAYLNQKRDFLANSAHELRTPLAAIRSTVEVALTSGRERADYEELLAGVIDECEALETLVNQLLLLAETEADTLKIHGERVRLDELVAKSVDMFEGVAEHKGITLQAHLGQPIAVEANRHHVRQVLNNLIDNAIKFTPAGGRIVVELTEEGSPPLATLRVRDTGAGISEDDLPNIFKRFFRSDRSRPREGETRGTGLGLSICEAVIQSHGGQINVTSQPGQGTTFIVTLPISSTVSPAP